jgi:hypothetical protein
MAGHPGSVLDSQGVFHGQRKRIVLLPYCVIWVRCIVVKTEFLKLALELNS